MYTLSIQQEFEAQHFLIGGDWGEENELHSHQYTMEVRVSGSELDEHGFLLDIVDLTSHIDALVLRVANQVLNELTEFEGLNPSIEHFARILATELASHLDQPNLKRLWVIVYEDEIGWASYELEL